MGHLVNTAAIRSGKGLQFFDGLPGFERVIAKGVPVSVLSIVVSVYSDELKVLVILGPLCQEKRRRELMTGSNSMTRTILVTGGAGFIGSAVARFIIERTDDNVVVLDKLTYCGNLDNLAGLQGHPRFVFEKGDICDRELVDRLLERYRPSAVLHLAAESHVDRSIDGPKDFINTNIFGTFNLLQAVRYNFVKMHSDFKFIHISTDEVYGDLDEGEYFKETTPYAPSSPYSASKASSDHLVNAWGRTYGLPVIITNCSNNYGPFQFPEKLIPLIIINCLNNKKIPIYGDGKNIRDWIYVEDHCIALNDVLQKGVIGETYNIGADSEMTNNDIVNTICEILNEKSPPKHISSYKDLIVFVKDRPGHDFRYAIDSSKIKKDLGWHPKTNFNKGIRETINWYMSKI